MISFILTEECDWGCNYCYFSHLENQKKPKMEIYQKHLPYIKKIMDIRLAHNLPLKADIQGGEVGNMPLELLQYFFQTVQYPIDVSTNGEFFKRGYHLDDKIRPYIAAILWHVTNDFKTIIETDYKDDKIHISRGIVHNNEDEIVDFIKLNKHITFDYIEFEFDIKEKREMNVLSYHSLLKRISSLKNITEYAKQVLEKRLSEKIGHRDNCIKFHDSIVIDLVNENICQCQRHLDDCIPLNKDNLIKRLRGFPKNFFKGLGCKSCTRLYAGKYSGNIIERTLLGRSLKYEN